MERNPQGRDRVWTINNVRTWMRAWVLPGQTAREAAMETAKAFGTWDMLRHLAPGDHWVFDCAAEALARLEAEKKAARDFFGGGKAA